VPRWALDEGLLLEFRGRDTLSSGIANCADLGMRIPEVPPLQGILPGLQLVHREAMEG
jgi:hypothetical protein